MKIRPIIIFLLITPALYAQQWGDSTRFDKRFLFAEGVYLNWESVRSNQPDYNWSEVKAEWVVNRETRTARLVSMGLKDSGTPVVIDQIKAIAQDSILYLRLEEDLTGGRATIFSGLWVQGRICLHIYEKEVTKMVEIKAYNPQTGKPFRSATVPTEQMEEIVVMVDFQTGAEKVLNRENLFEWISGDARLVDQISGLPEEDVDLIRVLEAYNLRNPYFIVKEKG